MFICEYCKKECKNKRSLVSHQRTCPHNANRVYKNGMTGKSAWNKGLSAEDDSRIACYAKTVSEQFKSGERKLVGVADSNWWRTPEAKTAYLSNGGYRANAGISKKFKVVDSYGVETTLQSSYELLCSEILNELGIKWQRPKALKYDGRNYFADFYLPEVDIWLDPKNDHKAKLDEEKIKKVIEQNNVKLFVLLKEHLTKEYIGRLAETD